MFKTRTLITILTWNRVNLTKDTVSSVFLHNKNNMRDILFIDNGSTDGTIDYIKSIGCDFIRNEINEGIFMASRKAWLEGVNRGYDFILNLQNDFPCVSKIPFDDIEKYLYLNNDVGFVRLNDKKKKPHKFLNYLTKKPIILEPWEKVGNTEFAKHNHHMSFNPNLIKSSIIYYLVDPVEKTRERQIMERFESLNMKSVRIKEPCPCFDTIIRDREDGWIH